MKSLSDAYKDHPINLRNIIPLDFDKVHDLPDSHAWPDLDQDSLFHVNRGDEDYDQTIPVIDMAENQDISKILRSSCEGWGAFQIVNHGIPISFLDEVEFESRRLFSLPTQQKLKALRSSDGVGGYGRPRMTPFFPKFLWHEGFTIVDSVSSVENASKLWAHGYHTQFCNVMEEYQKKLKELASRLMSLILDSLGITKEDLGLALDSQSTIIGNEPEGAHTALQLNSYPACPDPNRAMGLAAHTDTSLFTILYQSSTRGLQIHRAGLGWATVVPLAGALIVNIGDLLHILTNGRFVSALHRALVNETDHRLSVVYFYGPPCNSKIKPISKLVDCNYPLRYRSTTWKEYIGIKAKHFDKSLSFVAANPST